MLQELLNAGLVDIGADDSRFIKMQDAASALASRFREQPTLLISSTLLALDSEVNEDAPIFSLVEELVIAEWKTLRNTHVNRPRELLRSLVIDALANGITDSPETAGAVWYTAVGPLLHGQTRMGKSKVFVEKLLKQARDIVEAEAVQRAGLVPPSIPKRNRKKPTLGIAPLDIADLVNDDEFLSAVAGAAGPHYPGTTLDNPNPHWSNAAQSWSNEFTPRMTKTLVKAVNLGGERITESLSANLNTYFASLEKQLTEQMREVEQLHSEMVRSHDASRIRLDILWWSEALYSPLLQTGYRELALPVAAVAAAVDLTNIVPALAPTSVRYVLGETISRVARILEDDAKRPIMVYIDELVSAKVNFGETFPTSKSSDARLRLVDIVGEASTGSRVSSEALLSRTGVDADMELTAAEFAMWIFSDLQAQRLVETLQ